MQVSRQKNKLLRRITTLGMLLQFPQFYLVIQIIQPNEFAKKIKLNLHFRIVFTNEIHDQPWQRLLLNSSRLLLAGHSKHEKNIYSQVKRITYQRRWTEGSDLSKDILQFMTTVEACSTLRLDRPLDSSADLTYLRLSRPLETIIKSPLFNPKNLHPKKLFLIHRFIRTNHYWTCFLFSSRI